MIKLVTCLVALLAMGMPTSSVAKISCQVGRRGQHKFSGPFFRLGPAGDRHGQST